MKRTFGAGGLAFWLHECIHELFVLPQPFWMVFGDHPDTELDAFVADEPVGPAISCTTSV
jgi:hypothetical protein